MNNKKINHIEIIVTILSCTIVTLFIALLVISKWPKWWEYIIFERTPMTWLESILLFLCAITAFSCGMLTYISKNSKQSSLWLIISTGFILLTLDERFAIHERIRDSILAPRGVKLSIFAWTSPGDFILLIVCIISLCFVPFIYKLFEQRKASLILFISAFIVTIVAIVFDSIEWKESIMEIQRIEQFLEEILETLAMLLFFNSFFLMLTHYFKDLLSLDNNKIT